MLHMVWKRCEIVSSLKISLLWCDVVETGSKLGERGTSVLGKVQEGRSSRTQNTAEQITGSTLPLSRLDNRGPQCDPTDQVGSSLRARNRDSECRFPVRRTAPSPKKTQINLQNPSRLGTTSMLLLTGLLIKRSASEQQSLSEWTFSTYLLTTVTF